MYYPYLRGKQFELILIRDKSNFLRSNTIHPIIEPVRNDIKSLVRALKALNDENVACTLIVNPKVGEPPVKESHIKENLLEEEIKDHKNVSIGYILDAKTDLSNLIKLLDEYRSFSFTLVHYGFTKGKELATKMEPYDNIKQHIFIDDFAGKLYQRHFKKDGIRRILIRDGFKPQKKNSLYPISEHFSDLHITYPDEGMDGFGDFLIVGDDYSETGGPAYAVAIHLTFLGSEDDMFIYHFLSDKTDSPTDPGGKFLEALTKLTKAVNNPSSKIYKSDACAEFIELHKRKHFPGLGYVKKLSMQHHIELIANYLKSVI